MLAVACFVGWIISEKETRFLVALGLAIVYAAINFYSSFSKMGLLEELEGYTDERDHYIVSKATLTTMKVLNVVLVTGCFISLVLYGALKVQACIVVGITLCAVLLMSSLIMLGANVYYENHN